MLVDDYCPRHSLICEHGLSILVEADGLSFLVDTGQSGYVLHHNARVLGKRLPTVTVLTHGHYDHGGGLRMVSGTLYAGKNAFVRRVHYGLSGIRDIGVPLNAVEGLDLKIVSAPYELFPGVILSGPIPRATEYERPQSDLFVVDESGNYKQDQIEDEMAVYVKSREGIIVITGCAHAGIVNTIKHAQRYGDVCCIVGGTHLANASKERIEKTAEFLDENVERAYVCHCTGYRGHHLLRSFARKTSIFSISAGTQLFFK